MNINVDKVKKQYNEKGFVTGPVLFSKEEVDNLRNSVANLLNEKYDGDLIPFDAKPHQMSVFTGEFKMDKMNNAWWGSNYLRDAYQNKHLGKIAASLMDSNVIRIFKDQVFAKPGTGDSKYTKNNNVGWHQDGSAWVFLNNYNVMCTAWIALQDTDEKNGCLSFVEGSHEWGLFGEAHEDFYNLDMDVKMEKAKNLGLKWTEVPNRLQAGQVSFHHGMLIHGSYNNSSNSTRYGISIHFMPDGTYYLGKKHVLYPHPHLGFLGPNARNGTKLEGQFFPVIWPRPDDSFTQALSIPPPA